MKCSSHSSEDVRNKAVEYGDRSKNIREATTVSLTQKARDNEEAMRDLR